eukprot:4836639-Alexandrium_andersonii.AAC.1
MCIRDSPPPTPLEMNNSHHGQGAEGAREARTRTEPPPFSGLDGFLRTAPTQSWPRGRLGP